MIAIVLVSSVAFGIFSFAVKTSKISSIDSMSIPSQITSKTSMDPCSSSKTVYYLWDHVYAVKNGNPKWDLDPGRLDANAPCVTVTGTVYSKVGGGTEEDEGDLHFTLTLDKQYEKYSNSEDPTCVPLVYQTLVII